MSFLLAFTQIRLAERKDGFDSRARYQVNADG
jgi:hypothetical protein